MIAKDLKSITESDLTALIDSRSPESKTLEYKRELPESNDAGKVKFLKSVTSFANTAGGDLIYGMAATDGVPEALVALAAPSMDDALRRLEQLCTTAVDPRLTGVEYHPVDLATGGQMLVVRVPRSWNAPHRVTLGNHVHFYARNAAASYPMDTGELRRAFSMGDSIAERIRAFREERLVHIIDSASAVPTPMGARTVLHVIPLESFRGSLQVNVSSRDQWLLHIRPPKTGGFDFRLNLDGRVTFRPGRDGGVASYALLFRNGIVETVISHNAWSAEQVLFPGAIEEDILDVLGAHFPALQALGVTAPAFVFVSMVRVHGYEWRVKNRDYDPHRADRNSLLFPEQLVEDWTVEPATLMRQTFDMMWNAFGYERCFSYDKDGTWVGNR